MSLAVGVFRSIISNIMAYRIPQKGNTTKREYHKKGILQKGISSKYQISSSKLSLASMASR